MKAIIGNIPLSVSNTEILDSLKCIAGVIVRSRLFFEGYRDEDKTLTSFKTGRRFVYIDRPSSPLPKIFQVGQWKASLYHFGQNDKQNGSNQIVDFTTASKTVGNETNHNNENTPISSSLFTNKGDSDKGYVNKCGSGENNAEGKSPNKQTTKNDITNFLSRGRPEFRRSRSSSHINKYRSPSDKRKRPTDALNIFSEKFRKINSNG